MMCFMGIDIGSAYSKGVIIKDSELAACHVIPSGANYRTAAETIRQALLRKVNEHGTVTNFTVSEKCAAGSGRFIEVIANVLRIDLRDFGSQALKSKQPVTFSTRWGVFGA